MESFTASANPPESERPPVLKTKKPQSLHTLFIVLLIASLLSAGATTWILMSGATSTPKNTQAGVQTPTENPFTEEAETIANAQNPFTEETQVQATLNPFSDEEFTNFFDQFETQEAQANSGEYENPF